jgi:hypothetical protein
MLPAQCAAAEHCVVERGSRFRTLDLSGSVTRRLLKLAENCPGLASVGLANADNADTALVALATHRKMLSKLIHTVCKERACATPLQLRERKAESGQNAKPRTVHNIK